MTGAALLDHPVVGASELIGAELIGLELAGATLVLDHPSAVVEPQAPPAL